MFADSEHRKIKLIDFGISGKWKAGTQVETNKAGTLLYSPPEFVSGENIEAHPRIDIWSLGVIAYRMAMGKYPFMDLTETQRLDRMN